MASKADEKIDTSDSDNEDNSETEGDKWDPGKLVQEIFKHCEAEETYVCKAPQTEVVHTYNAAKAKKKNTSVNCSIDDTGSEMGHSLDGDLDISNDPSNVQEVMETLVETQLQNNTNESKGETHICKEAQTEETNTCKATKTKMTDTCKATQTKVAATCKATQTTEPDTCKATQTEEMHICKAAQTEETHIWKATQTGQMNTCKATQTEERDTCKATQTKETDTCKATQTEEIKTSVNCSIEDTDSKMGDNLISNDLKFAQAVIGILGETQLQNTKNMDMEYKDGKTESDAAPTNIVSSVNTESCGTVGNEWQENLSEEINQLDQTSIESIAKRIQGAIRKEVKKCSFFSQKNDTQNKFVNEICEYVKKMLPNYCREGKSIKGNGGAKSLSQTAKSLSKTSEIITTKAPIVEYCVEKYRYKQKIDMIKKKYRIVVSQEKDLFEEQIIGWKLSGRPPDVETAAAEFNEFLDGIVVHQEKHVEEQAISKISKDIPVLISGKPSEDCHVDACTFCMMSKRGITLHGWRWVGKSGQMITLMDGHYSQIGADFILIPKLGLEVDQDFGSQPYQSKRHVHFTVKPFDGGKSGVKKHLQDSITSAVKKLVEKQNCSSVCIPLDFAKLVHWQEEQFLKSVIFGLHSILPLKLHFTTGFSANGFERAVEVIEGYLKPLRKEPQRIIVDGALIKKEPQRDISISVCQGRIVESQVDVLVNLTDRGLKLSRGYVSWSIQKTAGMAMQTQCNADYPEGLQFGDVAQTDSHKMKNCRKVYHGVLPRWTDYESLTILSSLVAKCLELASRDGMKSIAFPALGTGRHGYSSNDVARVMIKAILDFDKSYPDNIVKDVQIVCETGAKSRVFRMEQEIQTVKHRGARVGKKIRLSPYLKFYVSQADISVHHVDGLVIFWHQDEVLKTEMKQYLEEASKKACLHFINNRLEISQCREPYVSKPADSYPYHCIIHRAVYDYRLSMKCAVQSVLQATEERKLASIGIVFLSKDNLMYNPSKVLDDLVSTTIQFDQSRKSTNLETIYIATDTTVIYDEFVSSVDAVMSKESWNDPEKEKSPKLFDITVVGEPEDVQKAVEQLTGKNSDIKMEDEERKYTRL